MDSRALLAEAARYRRLAKSTNDESAVRQYEAYARDLELRAADLDHIDAGVDGHGVMTQLLRHRGGALLVAAALAIGGWIILLAAVNLLWGLFHV